MTPNISISPLPLHPWNISKVWMNQERILLFLWMYTQSAGHSHYMHWNNIPCNKIYKYIHPTECNNRAYFHFLNSHKLRLLLEGWHWMKKNMIQRTMPSTWTCHTHRTHQCLQGSWPMMTCLSKISLTRSSSVRHKSSTSHILRKSVSGYSCQTLVTLTYNISDYFETLVPTYNFSDHFKTNVNTDLQYFWLYNLYKGSCPLIGWTTFNILPIWSIRWQNILLPSVWVGKSENII